MTIQSMRGMMRRTSRPAADATRAAAAGRPAGAVRSFTRYCPGTISGLAGDPGCVAPRSPVLGVCASAVSVTASAPPATTAASSSIAHRLDIDCAGPDIGRSAYSTGAPAAPATDSTHGPRAQCARRVYDTAVDLRSTARAARSGEIAPRARAFARRSEAVRAASTRPRA